MKVNNPKTSSKTYWSILKTFFNGRKIPIIPPLLKDGKLKSDFKIQAILIFFFASQCTPLANNSKLQDKLIRLKMSWTGSHQVCWSLCVF